MRDATRATLTLVACIGASSLLRVAYVVYAGRVLGPEKYADFYAALSVVLLCTAGLAPIGGATARFTSLYRNRGEEGKIVALCRTMPRWVARLAIGLFVIGVVLLWPLYQVLRFDSIWTLALVVAVVPVTLLVDTPRGILRGLERFNPLGLNLAGESALRLALCVALFTFQPTAQTALVAYLAAALAVLWVGFSQVKPVGAGSREQPFEQRELTRFMIPLFAFAIFGALHQNLDVLFVRNLFGAADAGHYSAASALSRVVGLAMLPFSIALLPRATASFARGESVLRSLALSLGGVLTASLIVLTVYHQFGGVILTGLYGGQYLAGLPLLTPLTTVAALAAVNLLVGQALAAMNSWRFLVTYAGGLAVQIALMLLATGSTQAVVTGVLIGQAITTLGLSIEFVRTSRLARVAKESVT